MFCSVALAIHSVRQRKPLVDAKLLKILEKKTEAKQR